ncbi:MAG: nuclear transport factor 2 family protein [Sphingomonadaceae bacterium]|nr:nuclear transport factor 2 family protein [Sphingomonadaceae bacterium]
MRSIAIAAVTTMGLGIANPAIAETYPAEEAAIKTVIEGVALLADRGEFDALERLYAPEVRIDYTSLAGGEPQVKSNVALMTEWASMLPGFDRTRHAISNIRVTVNGVKATATADVVADHWVKGLFWQVSGRYDYGLVKDGRDWKISFHKLTVTGEQGTRDVFGPAGEAAKADPAPYIQRQQTRAAVMDFLIGLETKDMTKVNSVWADDAVQDMPFSPEGHPKRVVGKAALVELYKNWPTISGKAEFTDGIVFHPTLDPQTVFVEYRGIVDVIPTGRTYRQTYGGLFHVDKGKITLFREYYDPAPFAWAFGLK